MDRVNEMICEFNKVYHVEVTGISISRKHDDIRNSIDCVSIEFLERGTLCCQRTPLYFDSRWLKSKIKKILCQYETRAKKKIFGIEIRDGKAVVDAGETYYYYVESNQLFPRDRHKDVLRVEKIKVPRGCPYLYRYRVMARK